LLDAGYHTVCTKRAHVNHTKTQEGLGVFIMTFFHFSNSAQILLVDANRVLRPQNYSRSTPPVKYSVEQQDAKRSGAKDMTHDVQELTGLMCSRQRRWGAA
jgi:hypothetical protein